MYENILLYLRYSAYDAIVYVRSQALYLRYSAYDAIVYVRSQALYLRYSTCDIILETKVTFMVESKTGFEISTKKSLAKVKVKSTTMKGMKRC